MCRKETATSGDNSDFPGSSGGEFFFFLKVEQCYIIGNLLYSCTKGPVSAV